MKIGIVTQPLGINIGGILQNWALQTYLIKAGHTPVTINYVDRVKTGLKDYLRIPMRNIRTFMRRLQGRYDRYMRLSDTRPLEANLRFVNNKLNATPRCHHYSPLDHAQAYIVGSDQVWRPRYNKLALADQYLKFTGNAQVKRIAYAASFGTDRWEYTDEQTRECAALAQKFDHISVREESAINLCSTYLNREAILVIDPTLLLSAADYEQLCDFSALPSRPYSASYFLDINSDKKATAERVAKDRNSILVDLNPRRATVGQWLGTISKSEAVITDSFHGTVFAIIFHRNFAVLANNVRGNSRLLSLLKNLGLENHLVSDEQSAVDVCRESPDWKAVEHRLASLRKTSESFLATALAD